MKKLKGIKLTKFFVSLLSLIFFFSFWSCKSAPELSEVDPLDLIDNQSHFYLRIPKSVDPKLVGRMLKNNLKGLSDSDAEKVTERIDTIYIGLEKSRKVTKFQLASSCYFPQIAVKTAFSKKNGWTSDKLTLQDKNGKSFDYQVYSNSEILASFPSTQIACLGERVPSMVEKYHNLSQFITPDVTSNLNQDIKDWLSYEDGIKDNQIRFFASKPQSFLTILTGANLNFKLIYVKGNMINDPESDNQYLMQLEFEFRDSRVVPAAKAMLSVAFGLTDSEVTMTSDTHLIISKIKINKNQLYKIFVI